MIGILVELFSLVPSLFLVQFFRRIEARRHPAQNSVSAKTRRTKGKERSKLRFPWWCIYIGYGLSLIIVLISLLLIIARGIELGETKIQQWFISLVISFFSSVLLTQPLKVFEFFSSVVSVDLVSSRSYRWAYSSRSFAIASTTISMKISRNIFRMKTLFSRITWVVSFRSSGRWIRLSTYRVLSEWSFDPNRRVNVWRKKKWTKHAIIVSNRWKCSPFFAKSSPTVLSSGSSIWLVIRIEIQMLFFKSIIYDISYWTSDTLSMITPR